MDDGLIIANRHALTFSTEIGGIKIEVESDLKPFVDQKLYGSDNYYLTKLKEIRDELFRLKTQKEYSDIIWKHTAFKVITGQNLHLYDLGSKYLASIISPDEWQEMSEKHIGHFILNSNGVWEKI
jgi:hypothetical protein